MEGEIIMDYTVAENQKTQIESETAISHGYLDYHLPKPTAEPERSWWPTGLSIGGLGLIQKINERLTNPLYGRDILDAQLKEMAVGAPGIKQVWKITESWPSLTKILLEDRNNE